jgi:hypothetical protein
MTVAARARQFKSHAPAMLLALLFTGLAIPVQAQDRPPPHAAEALADGSHDFDFEFGDWTMHLKRRLKPLTGSTEWAEYEGRSVLSPVWGGKANFGEIDLKGPAGRIQGLTLRLYDPQTRQWNVTFANISGAEPGKPMYGRFKDGRGEFYGEDTLNGRAIYARFVFSGITPASFRFEQAFSADGGKTWEVNWISTFTRRS